MLLVVFVPMEEADKFIRFGHHQHFFILSPEMIGVVNASLNSIVFGNILKFFSLKFVLRNIVSIYCGEVPGLPSVQEV